MRSRTMLPLLLLKESKSKIRILELYENILREADTRHRECFVSPTEQRQSGISKVILIWKVPLLAIPDNPRVFYQHGPASL